MLSTMGYTSVAFVSGALAWWGPIFLASGFALQEGSDGLIHMAQLVTFYIVYIIYDYLANYYRIFAIFMTEFLSNSESP